MYNKFTYNDRILRTGSDYTSVLIRNIDKNMKVSEHISTLYFVTSELLFSERKTIEFAKKKMLSQLKLSSVSGL